MQILNIPIYFSYRAKSPNNGGQESAWHAPRDSGHDFSLPGPSWHPGIEGFTNLQWLPSFFQCRKSSLGVMRIRILDPHHSIFSLFLKLVIFSKKNCNMCYRDMNAKLRSICSTPILWRRVRFSRPVTLRTLWTCINLMKGITVQLSLKGLIWLKHLFSFFQGCGSAILFCRFRIPLFFSAQIRNQLKKLQCDFLNFV